MYTVNSLINISEVGNWNLKCYCSGNLEISWSSTIFLPYVLLPLLVVGTTLLWQLSPRMTPELCLLTLCSRITILLEGGSCHDHTEFPKQSNFQVNLFNHIHGLIKNTKVQELNLRRSMENSLQFRLIVQPVLCQERSPLFFLSAGFSLTTLRVLPSSYYLHFLYIAQQLLLIWSFRAKSSPPRSS